MVVEGDQMVVGDVEQVTPTEDTAVHTTTLPSGDRESTVGYETLCRQHHMRRQTSRTSPSLHAGEVTLPFEQRSSC